MVKKFEDHFWDGDFNGVQGYDLLICQLKQGKAVCDDVIEFIRNKQKIEDEYGKNLVKLAQSTPVHEGPGSFKDSLDCVKKETEHVGNIHCDLARKLGEMVENAVKFREKQKLERLKMDERLRKSQKEKKTAYESVFKAKKSYEQKCREADQSREAFDGRSTYTPREEDRLKKNVQKSKTLLENADSLYQSNVNNLEGCRTKWITDMKEACQVYQCLEEGRIEYLRNELWLFANHSSTTTVDVDERYEACRKSLEKCDYQHDIDLFVSMKRTGSQHPAAIAYENFYVSNTCKTSSLGRSEDLSPRVDVRKASAISINNAHINPALADNEGYAEVQGFAPPHKFLHRVQAQYDYNAQGSQELSLAVGDIINVMRIEDSEWALGVLNGVKGAFPRTFVRQIP